MGMWCGRLFPKILTDLKEIFMEIQIYSFFFQNIFTKKNVGKSNIVGNSKNVIVLSKMHFKKRQWK